LYCLAALGCSLFVISGTAGTVSVGFEGPSYAVGDINGQQGWSKTGSYDAQVSSSASYQGSQSLRISNGITSGSFGDQTFTPQLAVPAGESTVPGAVDTFLSSWYFKSVTGSLQDGLGISVSADNGQGARMTWVRMGDDAVNGLNLQFYDTDSTGNFVFQQLTTNLDRSVWHRAQENKARHARVFIGVSEVAGPSIWISPLLTGPTMTSFRYFSTASLWLPAQPGKTSIASVQLRTGVAAGSRR
jgi:hypothetical protein